MNEGTRLETFSSDRVTIVCMSATDVKHGDGPSVVEVL